MRRFIFVTIALAFSCSRETPAPPATPVPTTTTAAPTTETTATSVPTLEKGTYDEALLWFRANNGFHFVLDDQGVHAEGDLTRKTPGTEKLQLTVDGKSWRAETSAKGVTWSGPAGTAMDAPEWGARIYQRVTLPFDPQKKEGVPLRVSEEGATNLYQFTDANTGETHQWWVRKSDAAVERIKIGASVDLRIRLAPSAQSSAPSAARGQVSSNAERSHMRLRVHRAAAHAA